MFEKANVPILGMVQNMAAWHCPDCGRVDHIFGEGGAAEEASRRGIDLIGDIPLSLAVRQGSDFRPARDTVRTPFSTCCCL